MMTVHIKADHKYIISYLCTEEEVNTMIEKNSTNDFKYKNIEVCDESGKVVKKIWIK